MTTDQTMQMRRTTNAQRQAVAVNQNQQHPGSSITLAGLDAGKAAYSPVASKATELATMMPALAVPDYFGVANWANSQLPQIDPLTGGVLAGTGMRKFVDALPGICGVGTTNGLGQCVPLASPDILTFPGSDYYEIAVVEYREQMHSDLPVTGTRLRGYVQVVPSTTLGAVALTTANGLTQNILDKQGNQVYGATKPHYLGPMILATGCSVDVNPTTCVPRPVRVKFTNYLPTGPGGDLFLPTDTTYMGAGMGPGGSINQINLTSGGAGYTSAPTVVFNNTGTGGTGAAATAAIANGKVVAVVITNGGSGYTVAPLMSFSGGGATTLAAASAVLAGQPGEMYTQNRATLHLHGGNSPWISDGTPHQWTTPFGEATSYSKGVSSAYVPDMWFDANGVILPAASGCQGSTVCAVAGASNDPGLGSLTFYWTNQQSGRLLFYHDHSYGITRLNVYAGEAAGYLIADPTEEAALLAGGAPGTISDTANLANPLNDLAHLIPLVIQDKTFVPDSGVAGGQLAMTDPTWDVAGYGGQGDLWFPHVYMPNQNPADIMGANAYGRWDYGAWFWPPQNPTSYVAQPFPCASSAYPAANPPAFPPLLCPGIPNPSGVPEGFMDTPVVNGTAYPTLTVDPTSYRFQMLMAGNDRAWNLGLYVAEPLSIAVTAGGSGYTTPPTVGFVGGGGSGAAATATVSTGTVTGSLITNVGAGYDPAAAAPAVTITGNGTGATATAAIDTLGQLASITITNGGTGYTTATISIAPPPLTCTGTCTPATANAVVTGAGVVTGINVTAYGTGWTSAPQITLTGVGTGAAAIASINSEVKMVQAAAPIAGSLLQPCTQVNPVSGAQLAMALADASGNPLNGTGLQANCWPSTWPTDGRDGGVPDPTKAGPPFIQIGTESGLLPAPVVIPSTPVNYEYFRRSITVLNIFTHGLLLGPAERADVLVDFTKYAGQTLILYNDAPAPVPAFDARNDYYTGDPDQTMSGGAPTTLPGYGPNTRTIMQIKVNAVSGTGTKPINVAALTTAVASAFATRQNQMIVPEQQFPAGNGASATPNYARIQDTSMGGWFGGPVGGLTLTNAGAGYSQAPSVAINGGGGTGATAAVTFTGGNVNSIAVTNPGVGYTSAPTVVFNNTGTFGTGATATASFTRIVNSITVTTPGSGYITAPAVTIGAPSQGGVRATAVAVITGGAVTAINITNPGSGYGTTAPSVSIAAPPTGTRARASATVTGVVAGVLITNGGSGYASAPLVSFSGGGVPTTPAAATATILPGTITGIVLTNGGTGYTSLPTVVFTPSGAIPTTAAVATATPPTNQLLPKAIQELFTLDYGRMNATLGVELPFTNFFVQTTIPYGYIDPPTELLKDGEVQLWKITHNGVDTHFIHFHLYDVQIINRVGWDGMIKPPDVNEVGWKDTVRMNPLEDIIIALRPMQQKLPWTLPLNIRPLDVTQSIGASNPNNTMGFANIDPTNQPAVVTNDLTNMGYEYVVHCHLLGHEENDMMRTQILGVPPAAPINVTATLSGSGNGQKVTVAWVDQSNNESGFSVQRAIALNGPWLTIGKLPPISGTGTALSFVDTSMARRTSYYYRVMADNVIGYTKQYAAPAAGYPTMDVSSAPVNAAAPITTLAPSLAESPIFADSFETGLDQWSGMIGAGAIDTATVMGPHGGKQSLAINIASAEPTYVYANSPFGTGMYDANFYFDPNVAKSDDAPIDIYMALDQNGQPIFGIQFQTMAPSSYAMRAWVLQAGGPVYTDWSVFTPEHPTEPQIHKLEVAWVNGGNTLLSFYLDDAFVTSLAGDTSTAEVSEALLGAISGMTPAASGTLYFDEFTSSSLPGVTYGLWLPIIGN